MTPKEKAIKRIEFYYNIIQINSKFLAKNCALSELDEILKTLMHEDLWIRHESNIDEFINFWEEVKQEIEKL